MRTALCAAVFCTLSAYGGTETKAKPSDYPASIEAPSGAWIAADFGGHTFSAEKTTFLVEDYLCIEVALFPPSMANFPVAASHFTLQLNKHKSILAQTPGMVAASLKYPDWTTKPTTMAQVGPVVLGPRPESRFPGDPTDRRNRVPGPAGTDPAAAAQTNTQPKVSVPELVVQVSLEEGIAHAARSGYLYFPYRGNFAKLKSIELVYSGGSSPVTLKLR